MSSLDESPTIGEGEASRYVFFRFVASVYFYVDW